MALSVIVPCYNEEGNIPALVDRFHQLLLKDAGVEVIFVNNGSTDNSAGVFKSEFAKYPGVQFKVVNVVQNQGYGFGILSGLKNAKGDVLAWTHADLQTDPLDVLIAYDIFEGHDDPFLLVKGSRKKRRLAEAFFTFGMEIWASISLSTRLSDINAQPKLFSKVFFDTIAESAPYDFSLDLYLLYMAQKKGRIITFPVYFNKRLHGEAKGGGSLKTRIKLIKRTFAYIRKLKREIRRAH